MMTLENKFENNLPSHTGRRAGDVAKASSITVGYKPTHTAIAVFALDGSRICAPSSSNVNQLANDVSSVRNQNSLNFLPSSDTCWRSVDVSHRSRSAALLERYSAVHSS